MRSTDHAVVVNGLGKSFGSVKALKGISFKVRCGEVLGLLGPNGAGKTTTVSILSTLTRPDSGYAEVAGYDVESQPAGVRKSIMLTGQHVALDDMLTGRENLMMFGRLRGLRKRQARTRATELLDQFDLMKAADRGVSTYSGGMRRRIDIACGLVVRPEVVFLDEPTTGLDPRSRQGIWELVSDFKRAGIATLLTTQYLEEADTLSDRIIVIDHGRIIAEGTANELKERTGGTYCEVVPRHLDDLPAVVEVLRSLVPDRNQVRLPADTDRVAMPAPDGPHTLAAVLHRLNAADIDLADIALRRPSLDEVFLQLTGEPQPDEPEKRFAVERSLPAPTAMPRRTEPPRGATMELPRRPVPERPVAEQPRPERPWLVPERPRPDPAQEPRRPAADGFRPAPAEPPRPGPAEPPRWTAEGVVSLNGGRHRVGHNGNRPSSSLELDGVEELDAVADVDAADAGGVVGRHGFDPFDSPDEDHHEDRDRGSGSGYDEGFEERSDEGHDPNFDGETPR